jgi:hypothetical protein
MDRSSRAWPAAAEVRTATAGSKREGYRDERAVDRDREPDEVRRPLLPPERERLRAEVRPRELDHERPRELELEREELERERDELERDLDELDRDLDELAFDPFAELRREPEVRLVLRRVLRRRPFDRWSLGTSALTTARVSCGMSRSR